MNKKINTFEVTKGSISDLDIIYPKFQKHFPENERKSFSQLKELMNKGSYKLLLVKTRDMQEVVIGYAFIYCIDDPKALWLDYIAINEEYQNKGIGSMVFNHLVNCKSDECLGMFMEIEKVVDNDLNQKKRIAFYERLGAVNLGMKYLLPTDEGGYDMHLFFRIFGKTNTLCSTTIKKAIKSTHNYIHSDINEREYIYNCFKDDIKDIDLQSL